MCDLFCFIVVIFRVGKALHCCCVLPLWGCVMSCLCLQGGPGKDGRPGGPGSVGPPVGVFITEHLPVELRTLPSDSPVELYPQTHL